MHFELERWAERARDKELVVESCRLKAHNIGEAIDRTNERIAAIDTEIHGIATGEWRRRPWLQRPPVQQQHQQFSSSEGPADYMSSDPSKPKAAEPMECWADLYPSKDCAETRVGDSLLEDRDDESALESTDDKANTVISCDKNRSVNKLSAAGYGTVATPGQAAQPQHSAGGGSNRIRLKRKADLPVFTITRRHETQFAEQIGGSVGTELYKVHPRPGTQVGDTIDVIVDGHTRERMLCVVPDGLPQLLSRASTPALASRHGNVEICAIVEVRFRNMHSNS